MPSVAAVGTDYNNDRAVDIVLTGALNPALVFQNPREGKFPSRNRGQDRCPPRRSRFSARFQSRWLDGPGFYPLESSWNYALAKQSRQGFEPVELPKTNWTRAFGVAAFDYDNDGWIDLVAVGETADGKGEVRLFRNLGPDGFKDVTADVGLDKIQLKDPRAIITADYDGDGATDLLITQNHGPAVLLRNEGGNKNNWLRLSFKGLADNKSAIGTKVEVFAGANRQKFEIAGSSGYLGQNSADFVVGLGQAKEADVVRMLWPTGVMQDEIQIAGMKDHSFRRNGPPRQFLSHAFCLGWNHYELVGDMLGAGVVGHWIGPNQRDIPRPTEYIKVPRNSIREKDGKLSFRFMEPLEEAVYLDQVKLLAVDHPAADDVFPNEYFASNPPYPPFKVVSSRDARPPAGARDEHGHNVLPDLLAHRYFGDFEVLPFQGFTKSHTLELDLGEAYRGGPLWLLMHGEIEYFSATSMFAAYQAGIEPIAPYVEAQDASGKWVRVIDDMGFPAGGPRTMTADLTGQTAAGNAAHPHHDQSADLLGQHSDQSRRTERQCPSDTGAAGARRSALPRISAEDRKPAARQRAVRLREDQRDRALHAARGRLHALRRRASAAHRLRRPPGCLRIRRRSGSRFRSREAAGAAQRLGAGLLLRRQRLRKRYGLLRRRGQHGRTPCPSAPWARIRIPRAGRSHWTMRM